MSSKSYWSYGLSPLRSLAQPHFPLYPWHAHLFL
jgi:hypothetical protein